MIARALLLVAFAAMLADFGFGPGEVSNHELGRRRVVAVIGRSEKHAREILDSPPIRFTSLLAPGYLWARAGLEHPFGPEFRGMIDFVPQNYEKAQLQDAMRQVDPDVLSQMVVWGTPQTITEKLRPYLDIGLRQEYSVNLVAIRRQVRGKGDEAETVTQHISVPRRDAKILPGDVLVLVGSDQDLANLPDQ